MTAVPWFIAAVCAVIAAAVGAVWWFDRNHIDDCELLIDELSDDNAALKAELAEAKRHVFSLAQQVPQPVARYAELDAIDSHLDAVADEVGFPRGPQ